MVQKWKQPEIIIIIYMFRSVNHLHKTWYQHVRNYYEGRSVYNPPNFLNGNYNRYREHNNTVK
jgi:hypothetical protein